MTSGDLASSGSEATGWSVALPGIGIGIGIGVGIAIEVAIPIATPMTIPTAKLPDI